MVTTQIIKWVWTQYIQEKNRYPVLQSAVANRDQCYEAEGGWTLMLSVHN